MTLLQLILGVGLFAGALGILLSVRKILGALAVARGLRLLAAAWICLAVSQARFGVAGVESATGLVDEQQLVQIGAWLLSSIITLVLILRHGLSGAGWKWPGLFLLCYGVLGLVSAVWAPRFGLAGWKSVQVIVLAILSIVAVRVLRHQGRPLALANLSYSLLVFVMLSVPVGFLAFPELAYRSLHIGGGGLFGGFVFSLFPFIHPNALGTYAALVVLISLARWWAAGPSGWRWFYLGMVICAFCVQIAAQSRTSFVALAAGLTVLALFQPRMRSLVAVMVIPVLAVASYQIVTGHEAGVSDTAVRYLQRGSGEKELETLSGRTLLWRRGLEMLGDSPVVGHGFASGARFGGQAYGIPVGTNMHNAHLQILVDSGLLGYVFWWAFMISTFLGMIRWRQRARSVSGTVRHQDALESAIAVAVLATILVRSLAGYVVVTLDLAMMLLVSFGVAAAAAQYMGVRSGSRPQRCAIGTAHRGLSWQRSGS